jgi:hypothetical protein
MADRATVLGILSPPLKEINGDGRIDAVFQSEIHVRSLRSRTGSGITRALLGPIHAVFSCVIRNRYAADISSVIEGQIHDVAVVEGLVGQFGRKRLKPVV